MKIEITGDKRILSKYKKIEIYTSFNGKRCIRLTRITGRVEGFKKIDN